MKVPQVEPIAQLELLHHVQKSSSDRLRLVLTGTAFQMTRQCSQCLTLQKEVKALAVPFCQICSAHLPFFLLRCALQKRRQALIE
jgi:hypothetical protein